ncbi:hypothetical protein HZS_7205 [Henneguya salminicola]|nr:hypothetical protein HZS_7205 [Henneguya salminicola]
MAKSSSLGRSLLKAQAKRNIRNKGVELGGKKENFVSENNQSNIKSCVLLNCPVEELMFIKEFTGNSYLKAKNEETVIERPIQHINELGDKFCPIFKRPAWTRDMTCEQVNHNEKEAFLEYKRNLYNLQSSKNKAITPFEKNIEIWRQLWRVIEYRIHEGIYYLANFDYRFHIILWGDKIKIHSYN